MSDNLSDELIARGLKSVNRLNYIYDAGVTLGGPIKKDRLWFFGSFREWGNERQAANKFYNVTQGTPFYTPDLSRPAFAQGVVRVEGRAGDVAGVGEKQVQLLRRSAAGLPLSGADGERVDQRAGSVFQLSPQTGRAVSGHLERAGHQQAAVRGRRRRARTAAGRPTGSRK